MLSFLILSTSFKSADGIKWNDFNTGYQLAVKKNKILLVDVYTNWCGWCKVMDRETYAKQEVSSLINDKFIPVKFNPEIRDVEYEYNGKKYNGQQLTGVISNYQLKGYPATIFINTKTHKISLVSGYKNAQEFTGILNNMLTEMK